MPENWEPKWSEEKGWYVSYSIKGHRIRRRLRLRDRGRKALAKEAARKLFDEEFRRSLEQPHEPGKTFFEAAAEYVDRGGEARVLPPIMQYFGKHMLVEEINNDAIEAAASAIYPGRAASTVQRQLHTPIGSVLRYARGQKRRNGVDKKRTVWLTPEEAERLLDHAGPVRSKIAFLLGTGCRTGEMFAAQAKHLNIPTRQCWISGEERGAGKTDAASRWVRIPLKAWSLLENLPSQGHLFLTPKGQPYALRKNGGGQMQTAFNIARDAAGLGPEITPHVLRHTWATWYYSQTMDFGGLMDLGGWKKAETANRYRKIAPDDLAERLGQYGWDFRHKSGTAEDGSRLRVVK